MIKIREMIQNISPILIKPTSTSLTISLSKRFFLFTLMNKAIRVIEDDPYLNFVSLLKNYKILGRFLYGTVREFYRDRNKLYFKNFFWDTELYRLVKADLKWLKNDYPDIRMTITKRGIIVYDNYKKNSFNVFLMTSHNGTWIQKKINAKLNISKEFRFREEDVDTGKIYSRLVLEKGGIWIDNKQSRFACDFNRHISRAIYTNKSEAWYVRRLWKKKLIKSEIKELYKSYSDFYFTLGKLVDAYRFNIIFDAHSMSPSAKRPIMSFGVKYVPHFYLPIVKSMRKKLVSLGYHPVTINTPYGGGYILKWLNTRFPDVFIFSMEVSKKLYMARDRTRTIQRKLEKVSKDITQIFDIEVEQFD